MAVKFLVNAHRAACVLSWHRRAGLMLQTTTPDETAEFRKVSEPESAMEFDRICVGITRKGRQRVRLSFDRGRRSLIASNKGVLPTPGTSSTRI